MNSKSVTVFFGTFRFFIQVEIGITFKNMLNIMRGIIFLVQNFIIMKMAIPILHHYQGLPGVGVKRGRSRFEPAGVGAKHYFRGNDPAGTLLNNIF